MTDSLMACLQAVRPPADVEEWLRVDTPACAGVVPSTDYRQAVHDVLAALGVVSAETGQATSPMAYYFVQSILHAIHDKAYTPANWHGLRGETDCTGSGARLVHLLEENRLGCCPNPTPLRIVQAVTAVIKGRCGDQDVYLMQYDAKAEQFQPIGGKREAFDADNVAALTREICEELFIDHLTAGRDFRVRPLLEHLRLNEVSASVHVITQYDHSFYHLTDIRFPIRMNDQTDTRWLTAAEVTARRTVDGYAVSALFDDYMPGVLATLGYSLSDPVC
ncbi:MAG: hypothetical protein IT324_14470 [Anaerolineae bacterium]|nr:hypothetical protein [Anaerolineae bacterium]